MINYCSKTPDGKCIDCKDLAGCGACEAWLLGSISPAVTIEIDRQATKKRFYFSKNDKSLGMIEILTTKGGGKS